MKIAIEKSSLYNLESYVQPMEFTNEWELLTHAKRLEGMRFSDISRLIGELDIKHRKHTKGVAAKVIETDYFGIPSNSSEKPDFENLGIELKVSPLRYVERADLYTTKERNVLKMVDYNEIIDVPHWMDTKVYDKLRRILFVLYVHDKQVPAEEWRVVKTFLWSPDESDCEDIQRDYQIMREKVSSGETLREGDHTIFATCPKHGGGFLRHDPLGSPRSALAEHPILEMAEKRGYCIKREAFIALIADAIGAPLVKKGRTIGLEYEYLEW